MVTWIRDDNTEKMERGIFHRPPQWFVIHNCRRSFCDSEFLTHFDQDSPANLDGQGSVETYLIRDDVAAFQRMTRGPILGFHYGTREGET